jgi:anti-anti-sigma factor
VADVTSQALASGRRSYRPGDVALAGATVRTASLGGHAYVLAVQGELDLASMPELETRLRRLHELGGRHFIVDLSSVTFIDSTALGLLLREARRLERDDGSLLVVASDPTVLRTFALVGAPRSLDVRQKLADALEAVRHRH